MSESTREEVFSIINGSTELQSLLYDLKLLPEVVQEGSPEEVHMLAIVFAFKLGQESKQPEAGTVPIPENEEKAVAMHLVAERWLRDNVPARLKRGITWPKERFVGRMGDMAPLGDSYIRIGLDSDNDVCVEMVDSSGGVEKYQRVGLEFCTPGNGGGQSPRTREALIALMCAIEEDNATCPSRQYPPKG